jgi:hypothetical membrane protein
MEKCFLFAGILVPIFYFGNLLVASLFYPGYSHITQYASELGGPAAPYPLIFNLGVIATGMICIEAGVGFYLALNRLTGSVLLSLMLALCLAAFGLSFIMGGLFPIPDERHGGFGLGFAIHAAPFLLATALWKHKPLRGLTYFLLANGLLALALVVIMMGVGELVTRANVGLWQRFYALAIMPWIGVASYALLRYLKWRHERYITVALRPAL